MATGPVIAPGPVLPLTRETKRIVALPSVDRHRLALAMLYSPEMRRKRTVRTLCMTVLAAIFPTFKGPIIKVTPVITGQAVTWQLQIYGTPLLSIPEVPDDTQHRLGLYHATLNILIALFKDSRDNSHMRRVENRFRAFKLSVNVEIDHIPYPAINVSAYVIYMTAQHWCHRVLRRVLSTKFTGPAEQMMVQVHMVARWSQMTTLKTVHKFLYECDSSLILIPEVKNEIPKFQEAYERLREKTGEWFPYAKAIRHPEAQKVTLAAFPNLLSAALYHAAETTPTMKNYRVGKQIKGGLPENTLKSAFERKLSQEEQAKVHSFRITGEMTDEVAQTPTEAELSMEDD
ncbi:endogenous Bornavirus-like nucleoprotein 1 [Orycteropus afer afer]|uniref:Endogenous Bornavirus-like nucleoprotein 1 n=2 Tax=Orycteropus afer afer TaxID=1230840 RepID=A0AC54Z8V9_ORYAF|nr:endogenous Bornavirus-like nucleoprotein 1 [Orycteropus afer afer]XP_042637360.1 endogenous Bornavirus-like nucleoprotein 1 [Orycteropus afer afer]